MKKEANNTTTNIIRALTDHFDQKTNESDISNLTNKKDVFRYFMEDVDESSSENNTMLSECAANSVLCNAQQKLFRRNI